MIYLDNHATTPLDPRVLDAMLPYLKAKFGNASSRSHRFGWEADEAVERARGQVAALLGADPREIVFTSGATEANNLALKGCGKGSGDHYVVSPIEHPSVLDTARWLETQGAAVTVLPVDDRGRVDPAAVADAITDRTVLCSVMTANNEIGTVQPIREIGRVCEERGVLFHTDATQGVGKIPFDVRADHVHLASLTAHKMHGPKGCGALYVRRRDPRVELAPQQQGGGQERGRRAGTLNVPGIVGLGAACEECRLHREEEADRVARLRDRLQAALEAAFPDLVLNGDPDGRLPGNLHVSFPGVDSQTLMLAVQDIAVSAGSACASGTMEPSHVMKAIGAGADRANSSVRFGLGRFTTEDEIDRAAEGFIAAIAKLRKTRTARRGS